jgi:hypothetical protein
MTRLRTFDNSLSLSQLVEKKPDLWQGVVGKISQLVAEKKMDLLAALAAESASTARRWSLSENTEMAKTQHAETEWTKARMTLLAIEQFGQAFTGTHKVASKRDQFVLFFLEMFAWNRGVLLTQKTIDHAWSILRDPKASASRIHDLGYWSIPSLEVCEQISELANGRSLVEVGAGRGLFVAGLRSLSSECFGVDDLSWGPAERVVKGARKWMKKDKAELFLDSFRPKVVLSVWPPPSNGFEKSVFSCPSVEMYLAIVSRHRFASGDMQAYRSIEGSWSCTTNEIFNKKLRPVEAEQQMLVFRRLKA